MSASKRSTFYHQSGQETLLPLLNALTFYVLQTKPNIQLQKEIRSENQVLAFEEDYWRLSVRRSSMDPVWNIRRSYRTRSGFTHSKPYPTFNSDRKLCVRTKYLLWKRTIAFQAFVVLPWIRPGISDSVIERAHVLRT